MRAERPTVLVTWLGWEHDELNLGRVDQLRDAFVSHLEQSSGKQSIFMESAGASYGISEGVKNDIRNYGGLTNFFIAGVLRKRYHQEPSMETILKSKNLLKDTSVEVIIDKQLLSPIQDVSEYCVYAEIDRLKEKYDFEIDLEAHPGPVAQELTRLDTLRKQHIFLIQHGWHNGLFDQALQAAQKADGILYRQENITREQSLVDELKKRVRKLQKDEGGSIFIPFGEMHYPVIPALQRKLGHSLSIEFVIHQPEHQSMATSVDHQAREREIIPDLVLGQLMLARQIRVKVLGYLRRKEVTLVLANHYGLFNDVAETVAQSFPLAEIREMCEKKVDLVKMLQGHPLAASIRSYIP